MSTFMTISGEDQFIYEFSGTVGSAMGEFAFYTNRIAECPIDVHVKLTSGQDVECSLRTDSTEAVEKPLKVDTQVSGWTLKESESLYLNVSAREAQEQGPDYTLIVRV